MTFDVSGGLPDRERSRLAEGLGLASTAVLCAVLPIAMVIANKSAPASLVLAALLANAAAVAGGHGQALARRYLALPRCGLGLFVAAVLALAILSLVWSVDRGITIRGLITVCPEILAGWALATAWPMVARRGDLKLLFVGIVGAAGLTLAEAAGGMPLHHLVGARALSFDLKRGIIPQAVLLWPAIAVLPPGHRLGLAAGLYGAVLAGAIAAHSATPAVGIVVSLGVAGLAVRAPRATVRAGGTAILILLMLAPWTGTLVGGALPEAARATLSEQHADNRIQIWAAFERHLWKHPLVGHGFNTSFVLGHEGNGSTASETVIDDIHPHNMLLQVWIELGLLGACLMGAGTVVMLRSLLRTGSLLFTHLGFLTVLLAEALVGLNAWEPWWLASIAAALLVLGSARGPVAST